MDWSPQQDAALKAVDEWLNSADRPIFRLFGYAGTGKTTLARHFAESVAGPVLFGAYTGKAAMVMRKNGCHGASTLHSLIYVAEQNEKTGKTNWLLNESGPLDKADLIIVDECSMVDKEMGEDLLSFDVPILVLGDPAQLPPVKGGGYFTSQQPDVMLTEIHRQAADNPIVRIATDIREGRAVAFGEQGETKIIPRKNVDRDEILQCDQVLVGKNDTRRKYNQRIRQLLGRDSVLPGKGDRLVCLKNNRPKKLNNGSLWEALHVPEKIVGSIEDHCVEMEIRSLDFERQIPIDVMVRRECFAGDIETVDWKTRRDFDEFDFGYALTVHKAQGSQWDHVVLFDESATFRDSRARWLYTGVTRAAEKLTICR